jgi:hypothetical protein
MICSLTLATPAINPFARLLNIEVSGMIAQAELLVSRQIKRSTRTAAREIAVVAEPAEERSGLPGVGNQILSAQRCGTNPVALHIPPLRQALSA